MRQQQPDTRQEIERDKEGKDSKGKMFKKCICG